MCGIVGYFGARDPKEIILDGLAQLEYRGYDSAGIAVLNGAHFKNVRAPGKLSELAKKLEHEKFSGHLGIGHTRWATHGAPSERNAHPHIIDGVCLVHNGIIENYMEIRERLQNEGSTIHSDTDSELVAHLIARAIRVGAGKTNLEMAVREVLPLLHGAYAIVVASEKEPDKLVAFKNGPPLIAGLTGTEVIIASDIQAIVRYASECIYLNDGDILVTKGSEWYVMDANGARIKKSLVHIDWSSERAEKNGFSHFMLKEIFEQPRTIAAALEPFIDLSGPRLKMDVLSQSQFAQIDRVQIVACGSSYYSGMVGEYLIEKLARIPVEVEFASEFRYRQPLLNKNCLVMVISQSGETADTLAALRLAKSAGALTMSICNVKNSTIDRESDVHIYMRSGVEVGVASTKAMTSSLAVLNGVALWFAKARGLLSDGDETRAMQDLLNIPSEVEKVLNHSSFFEEWSHELKKYRGFLYIGRGVNYPIALEGALKLKEIAYMHAEGYAAGEMKHGPIALIDSDMAVVVVAPNDDVYEKTVSNLEEVRARGAQIISFGSGENSRLKSISRHYLALPNVSWNLNPLVAVVPLQLLAFHIAKDLGHDVDQPRNLAKSVTVE
jgi:glucosamine--fructose-6-phosphate aminotransferase (isomerizing)